MTTDEDRNRAAGVFVALFLGVVIGLFAVAFMAMRANARDLDGQFTNSPLHAWFDHLASKKGLCCSMADGRAVEDPDWESKNGHYRVKIGIGDDYKTLIWVDVPDDAVITEPNRAGRTMVWPIYFDGQVAIRCFMPGSMT